jgi:hypothetical protein
MEKDFGLKSLKESADGSNTARPRPPMGLRLFDKLRRAVNRDGSGVRGPATKWPARPIGTGRRENSRLSRRRLKRLPWGRTGFFAPMRCVRRVGAQLKKCREEKIFLVGSHKVG